MCLSLAVGLYYLRVVFKSKISDLFPSSIGWLFECQIITVMVSFVCQFQWTTGGPGI